jgi:N-acyl-D-amino-acid deacylase
MNIPVRVLSLALLCLLASCRSTPQSGVVADSRASTLITNAFIVDGSGKPGYRGSVRIADKRIVAVGALLPAATDNTVIDAGGLTLAPGFIDTHSHHEDALFENLDALPVVTQGVTTIVAGQDGSMTVPVKALFKRLEQTPAAINVASYIGHNTLRTMTMGLNTQRLATEDEIKRMRDLIAEGMKYGALGLSTGLEYDSGIYSDPSEVLQLAQETAAQGGRYISHIRSEDRDLWRALDEIVNIGRVAKLPVQVSHMKLAMTDWWGQSARFLEVLNRARAEGIDITGDVYPYEYWQSTLTVMFPKRDFDNRETAEFILRSIAPADGLRLSAFSPEPALVGKTVAEIAAARGTDTATTLMALVAQSQVPGAEEQVIGTSMREEDIGKLIAWPHTSICSDGAINDGHPRGAGSFPRVFRVFVRERRVLSLEQAVHKMTTLSAEQMGIKDRGRLEPGQYADLVLFDPATITDKATTQNPGALSTGVAKVWVNGGLVYANGAATGVRSGVPVRRPE